MTTAFGTGVTGPDGRSLDQVQLTGVSARGYHGVLPSERQTGQEFRADVVLYLDTRPAAAGDDLGQTVSYADVASDVHDILSGEPADLVETVAERIAAAVLARPQVEAVDVRVHKPQAPIPVPFADVEVAIRRDRTHMPVVAAPAVLAGSAAGSAASAMAPADVPAYAPDSQEGFRTEQPGGSWNDAAEHVRSDAPAFDADPVPQDFEPVARSAADEAEQFQREQFQADPYQPEPYQPEPYQPEPAQHRAEAIEAEPLAERVPVIAATPAEAPEPQPVPELIAPEPLQVVPAAWEPQPDVQVRPEQRDQFAQEPVFQPEEQQQFRSEPVFEPVQQYESVQGLDQRQGSDASNGFEQQYDQFAQPEQQAQSEQQAQQFEQPGYEQPPRFDQQPQQFDQPQGYEQPQQSYEQPQQNYEQPQQFEQSHQQDSQQSQYDQLFEQQYDRADLETTRVASAVPDSAVGQPEQYAPEQYRSDEQQHEPRDRFDEIPAGAVDVVIAIGANLGDPQATMRSAVAELDRTPGLQITDVSPLARTAAVGGPEEQPDYLNAVLLARTTLSARGLLHACQEVENVHGRTREEHWGPRTLDVDLITYGNLTDSADDLEVPHPRAHERAFVLEPWSQIAPEAVLPGLGGGPVAQLAATAPDRAGIRWLALDWLTDPEPEQGAGAPASGQTAVAEDEQPQQDAHVAEMPPALPPSVPPSGRPPVTPGGPVVEVPGGGSQGQQGGQPEPDRQTQNGMAPHPQGYSSGPVPGPGGSVPIPQQVSQSAPGASRGAPPAGIPGNGSAVPPPEEALVPAPAPIAPRVVRDTAHEAPEHEPLPQPASAKPVFAPVNPSRPGGAFPPVNGAPQDPAAPVFAPVSTPPNGVADPVQNGHLNGRPNGHQDAYDNDHTVIRVPGFVGEQRAAAPSDGPIDSVPAWVPVRDERGRDA